MEENKGPGGRPSKYEDTYPEMLIQHMEQGLSYESFAGLVSVCIATLYCWEKDHPEFLEAKNAAFQKSRLFWEKEGIKGLWNECFKDDSGTTVSRSINSAVWVFNMKNRFKWRDKQPEEVPQPTQVTVQAVPAMTKEQALKLLEDEAKKAEENVPPAN